jgi:hypothetical protein
MLFQPVGKFQFERAIDAAGGAAAELHRQLIFTMGKGACFWHWTFLALSRCDIVTRTEDISVREMIRI